MKFQTCAPFMRYHARLGSSYSRHVRSERQRNFNVTLSHTLVIRKIKKKKKNEQVSGDVTNTPMKVIKYRDISRARHEIKCVKKEAYSLIINTYKHSFKIILVDTVAAIYGYLANNLNLLNIINKKIIININNIMAVISKRFLRILFLCKF